MNALPARKHFSESKVLITGLIRNGEKSLARDIHRLRQATRGFKATRVLLIESDSTDGTLSVLDGLSAGDPDFRYISLGHLSGTMAMRTQRLAHCRNAYLDELRGNPLYADVDHVLVSDLDGMNALLTADAVQSAWQVAQPWGVLAANQRGHYYDIWALRHPDWCPVDCLLQLQRLEPVFGHEEARDIAVYSRQIRIPEDAAPIQVESAFGGLALYTRHAMLSGGYEAVDAAGIEICEHVPHHRKIGAAGHGIFILPSLVNTGLTIHTKNKRPGKVIRNAIKAQIRGWRTPSR